MFQHCHVVCFFCQLRELLFVTAGGDAVTELVVHHQDLEYADSPAVAGMVAVIAAFSVVELSSGVIVDSGQGKRRRLGRVFFLAGGADSPQKSLRDDASKAGGNQVRSDAHILQTVDGRYRVLGMNGRDHEMAGHCGAHRYLCSLAVTDLADTDDVGVLSQDRTETVGECQPDFFVDLHLSSALDVILHRILQRDQVRVLT